MQLILDSLDQLLLKLFKELFLVFRSHFLIELMKGLNIEHLHLGIKHLCQLRLHLLLQLLG